MELGGDAFAGFWAFARVPIALSAGSAFLATAVAITLVNAVALKVRSGVARSVEKAERATRHPP